MTALLGVCKNFKVIPMDLIRIDIIIDKMVMLVWGLHHVFIHSNQNELCLQLLQHGTIG